MGNSGFSLKDITPRRIAAAKVDPEFFGAMMRKLADQHGDGQGPGDPYLAAFFAYVEAEGIEPGQGEDSPTMRLDDHLRVQAAVRRFFALGDLQKAGHLQHWVKEKGDHIMLHPALIEAASKAKLLVKGEDFSFQPLEFLNIALNSADVNQPF